MFSQTKSKFAVGQVGTPGMGGFMTIILTLDGDVITNAAYRTYPCPAASACGDAVATWAEGKRLSDIPRISEDLILSVTGPMPLGREHCPGLAVGALKDCLVRLEELGAEAHGLAEERQ